MLNGNFSHFNLYKELKNNNSTIFAMDFEKYANFIESLAEEFRRFSDSSAYENKFALFLAPFACDAAIAE